MGTGMGMGCFIHWLRGSQWIGARCKMGKTNQTGWSMRDITRGRAHHDSPDPTPLGPAGTPLVPALTHSTSGTVTGSNVRLGTSKDLSAGHETRLQHFGGDNTHQGATSECSDYHRNTFGSETSSSSGREIVERSRRRAPLGKRFAGRARTSLSPSSLHEGCVVRRVIDQW